MLLILLSALEDPYYEEDEVQDAESPIVASYILYKEIGDLLPQRYDRTIRSV